jgi:hypothetical protein
VISRDIEMGGDQTRVVLNVATTGWFGDSVRREFERRASAAAGEPVNLLLEQLPASSGDLSQLATLVSAPSKAAPTITTATPTPTTESRIGALRAEVSGAVRSLALPESLTIAGASLALGDSGAPPLLRLGYVAGDSLSTQAMQIVRRQLASTLMLPDLRLAAEHVTDAPHQLRTVGGVAIDSLSAVLARYPRLRMRLTVGPKAPRARVDSIVGRLTRGAPPGVIAVDSGGAASEIVARVTVAH